MIDMYFNNHTQR